MRSVQFSLDQIYDYRNNTHNLNDEVYRNKSGMDTFSSEIDSTFEEILHRFEEALRQLHNKRDNLSIERDRVNKELNALIAEGRSKGTGDEGVAYREMLAPQIDALDARVRAIDNAISQIDRQIQTYENSMSSIRNIQESINSSIRSINELYTRTLSSLDSFNRKLDHCYDCARKFNELSKGYISDSDTQTVHDIDRLADQGNRFMDSRNNLSTYRSESKDHLKEYQADLSDNISRMAADKLDEIYQDYSNFMQALTDAQDDMFDAYHALNDYYHSCD